MLCIALKIPASLHQHNYGYIQIDLGNDTEIGNIKIETDNPPSLVNTELIIANSLKNIVYRKLFTSLIPNGTITL